MTQPHLAKKASRDDKEWADGQDDESQFPAVVEADNEASDGTRIPLDQRSQLVTDAIMNLKNVTVGKGECQCENAIIS